MFARLKTYFGSTTIAALYLTGVVLFIGGWVTGSEVTRFYGSILWLAAVGVLLYRRYRSRRAE